MVVVPCLGWWCGTSGGLARPVYMAVPNRAVPKRARAVLGQAVHLTIYRTMHRRCPLELKGWTGLGWVGLGVYTL